ncbi:MAG: TonB-dependent receptor [Marinilabiliales bacterium]|nr:MAG: TonB-dependent receptor [Marinilabiliales bacterium]
MYKQFNKNIIPLLGAVIMSASLHAGANYPSTAMAGYENNVVTVHEHLRGVVSATVDVNGRQEIQTLPYASLYWAGTTMGVTSDENGKFDLHKPHTNETLYLVVSFTGYTPDTLAIPPGKTHVEILLTENVQLEEVTVRRRMGGSFISAIEPSKTEVITITGLQSLACCNLSESFENTATVDVGYSDAISGARRIQMLGLAGVYSQLMFENLPGIRGLSSAYGLTYIPGTWMESIQISKGTASVLNGYESTTGQINVEYKKPQRSESLFLNLFASNEGRLEANMNAAHEINDTWSTMLLGHVSTQQMKIDHNNNTFLDVPLGTQVNFMNRWNHEVEDRRHVQFGLHVLGDNKFGGQTFYDRSSDRGTTNAYGTEIRTTRLQGFMKAGFFLPGTLQSSIGFMAVGTLYDQESYFGLNEYSGEQKSLYSNIVYQSLLGNTNHRINTGISYQLDEYDEQFNDLLMRRTESVPGVFGEYTYTWPEVFTMILGLRADHHSIHDWFITPRMHFRYHVVENGTLRGSVGKGYRTANVFSEHSSIFASSRQMVFAEEFRAEEAWNYGVNYTHVFPLDGERNITWSADFYRTDFINQVIADIDQDVNRIVFYNLDGRSWSNSFQTDLTIQPFEGAEIFSAFRIDDVWTTINGELMESPLTGRYKGLLTLSYATRFDKWKFDITNQLNGPSRIPDTSQNPEQYRRPEYSPVYYIMYAQVTRRFRNMDIYVGGENLTNFKMHNPIIAADDPFGRHFDSSLIWGPFMGRKFYAGIRYTFN